jgi:predicted alpha/beta hydrolase family esterase
LSLKKIKYFLLTKSIGQSLNLLAIFAPKKAAQKAYELFSEPRKGRLSSERIPKTLMEPEKETFDLDGNSYQTYTWKGNNDIILLVHGWESNSSRWKKMLPYLKQTGKTIIAIDAPAHGFSSGKEFSVPKYTQAIAALIKKIKPKILIGHSIGGATCIYYQYLYQNPAIERLVLLGAPSDLKNLIINYCSMLGLNSKVQLHLENKFLEKFNFKVDDFSGAKFGSQITTKTLIAHDTNDNVVSVNEAKKLISNWESATFIETQGLGHSMHDEVLYEKIMAFLEEI